MRRGMVVKIPGLYLLGSGFNTTQKLNSEISSIHGKLHGAIGPGWIQKDVRIGKINTKLAKAKKAKMLFQTTRDCHRSMVLSPIFAPYSVCSSRLLLIPYRSVQLLIGRWISR